MRAFDRDLIRGAHYGQRSCEPRKKAEHMAAPTKPCYVKILLPTRAVHTWHVASFRGNAIRLSLSGSEADMNRQARPATSVANDPWGTSANCCPQEPFYRVAPCPLGSAQPA